MGQLETLAELLTDSFRSTLADVILILGSMSTAGGILGWLWARLVRRMILDNLRTVVEESIRPSLTRVEHRVERIERRLALVERQLGIEQPPENQVMGVDY